MLQLIDPELSREVLLLKEALKHSQKLMQILTEEPSRIYDDVFGKALVAIRSHLPKLKPSKPRSTAALLRGRGSTRRIF